MGMFDFVRSAGRLLGIGKADATQDESKPAPPPPSADAISAELKGLGLPADSVQVMVEGDTVKLHGAVPDGPARERIILAAGNVAGIARVDEALIPNLPFDATKDFAPVTLIGTAPMMIATHNSQPYQSYADVVKAAKAKPDALTYGTIGTGSWNATTGRYEPPVLTLTVTATGAGFSYDTVVLKVGTTRTNVQSITVLPGVIALAAGQSRSYEVQLAQDD